MFYFKNCCYRLSLSTSQNLLQERPLVVAELMSMFNHTEIFLTLGKNLTESEVFTEVEISTLSKLLSETKVCDCFK